MQYAEGKGVAAPAFAALYAALLSQERAAARTVLDIFEDEVPTRGVFEIEFVHTFDIAWGPLINETLNAEAVRIIKSGSLLSMTSAVRYLRVP